MLSFSKTRGRAGLRRLGLAAAGLLVVSRLCTCAADYQSTVLADAPSAYWRLDETGGGTAVDLAGGHTGTVRDIRFRRPGAIANDASTAFGFDGSSGAMLVPYAPELNGVSFSVECWLKVDSSRSGTVISSKDSVGGFDLYWNGLTWGFAYKVGGYGWDFLQGCRCATNEWTHVVCTCEGSNACLYVNGVLCLTRSVGICAPNLSGPLQIGVSTNISANSFVGELDELAIYGHALSAERVALHYGLGKFGGEVAPAILSAPAAERVAVGSRAALVAVGCGDPAPVFQWYKEGSPLPGATGSSLVFDHTDFSDTGLYAVLLTNALGATSSPPVKLSVMPSPRFCGLTNELVLHLNFDGDYSDSSGRANHAAAVGAPSFVPGCIGSNALHYNTEVAAGVYNYVTLGAPADLRFGSNVNFSVSYWVRFTGTPGDLPFFCNSPSSLQTEGFAFAASYKEGGWAWSLGTTDSRGFTTILGQGAPELINDGAWHHLLHTFDREGEGVTYLDGTLADRRSIIMGPTMQLPAAATVNVGQSSTGRYAESGEADLDDLGVWRRVLSPYEAQSVYRVGKTYRASFDSFGPVEILVRRAAGDVEVIWATGELEAAESIAGPWEPVAGAAAPYCRLPASGTSRFYRVKL